MRSSMPGRLGWIPALEARRATGRGHVMAEIHHTRIP